MKNEQDQFTKLTELHKNLVKGSIRGSPKKRSSLSRALWLA